jgi:hypothetical protein
MERVGRVPESSPVSVACYDFTCDGKVFEKRTVIIAPINIEELSRGSWKTGWACSRARYCWDEHCCYSKHSQRNEERE